MIVSHRYRFIFIKCKKTAGTSIEIALSSILGDNDIITPINEFDEKLRSQLCYRGPQNYLDERSGEQIFYNHMPAMEIRDRLGEKIWNDYYKFCFVRNPWDRIISHYYWHYREDKTPIPSIAEFIRWLDAGRISRYDNFRLYTIDGKISVDRIGRYENIEQDLKMIGAEIGLPVLPELPRAKGNYRSDRRHYREILSGEEREAIRRLCEIEIEHFGYQF